MDDLIIGLGTVFSSRGNRLIGGLIFMLVLPLYLMTLASELTGGVISPAALKYLNAEMIIFSLIMACLLALLLPVMLFLLRRGRGTMKSAAAGGVTIGVLTPLLCCSPILPLFLGFVATLFPALVEMIGWKLQKFIVSNTTEIYTLACVLLFIVLHQNARRCLSGHYIIG